MSIKKINSANDVYDRIKAILNSLYKKEHKDRDIAKALKIKDVNCIAQHRCRERIAYKQILEWCLMVNINPNCIFFEEKIIIELKY